MNKSIFPIIGIFYADLQFIMVLVLDLLGLLLVSSLLGQNQDQNPISSGTTSASRSGSPSFKYYTNRKGSQVVEVNWENRCHVFENGHAKWILGTRLGSVTTLNYIQFEILLQKCQLDNSQREKASNSMDERVDENLANGGQFTDENDLNKNIIEGMWNDSRPTDISPNFYPDEFLFNETDVSLFMMPDQGNSTENFTISATPLIYPGTKWCGRGDLARSEDDLGVYTDTDKCCREHDHCPDNILTKQSKHGLYNDGSYTRSHCHCDQKFLKCLESDQSLSAFTSFKIANLYYNILKPTCFDRRHPIGPCLKRRLSGECIEFEYDTQQPATWQFFPAQPYIVRQARGLFDNVFYRNFELTPRPLPTSLPMPLDFLPAFNASEIPRFPTIPKPKPPTKLINFNRRK